MAEQRDLTSLINHYRDCGVQGDGLIVIGLPPNGAVAVDGAASLDGKSDQFSELKPLQNAWAPWSWACGSYNRAV